MKLPQKRRITPLISLFVSIAALSFAVYSILPVSAAVESAAVCDISKNAFCLSPRVSVAFDALSSATIPKIATPSWMPAAPAAARTVTYVIETRGTITASLDEFASVANQTLNDSRGWTRLGVRFEKVESGGDFTLVLSEASQMTTFSANGCDTTYSCNVGRYVIVNQDRWLNATPSWTGGGGGLAEYRQMVINHETGHWLGHGHTYCTTKGQPATVMQQQSMDLQGCTPNPWPLAGELYAPTLGIRS